ncbi:MAG TPA: TetR/AcrR family transcriptional regulator, partial [Ramlibacter sp.]|nr:TetR/AcrR family transcriptional regulator [Ramlibacter sp.]
MRAARVSAAAKHAAPSASPTRQKRTAAPAPEAAAVTDATADLFLNAAEKLFAANGFESTPVRAIASEADVNLGTLHYYWGSKNGLIRAVLERRLKPVLADRKARYEQLLAAAGSKPVDIHALLEACLVPALVMPGADAAQRQRFRRLYGQALADPSENVRAIVDELYDESSRIFIGALRRCCAHIEDEEFFWRLNGIL